MDDCRAYVSSVVGTVVGSDDEMWSAHMGKRSLSLFHGPSLPSVLSLFSCLEWSTNVMLVMLYDSMPLLSVKNSGSRYVCIDRERLFMT